MSQLGQVASNLESNVQVVLSRMLTHGKRGATGGQNRAESIADGLLKRKYAHRKVLSRGNYASAIDNGQIVRPKRPE